MKKKFIVLWMILLLAVTACSQKIPESEKATLHLNVHFEKNWIFSKYDVDVLIDDKRVGSIDHGDDYEKDITIHNGDHSLTFRKHNNKKVYGSLSFSIDRLTSISCTIHAYHDEVDITDVEVLTYEEFNSAPIASFAISDIIVNKDESRSIGYETNPSEVIIKNEKVSVEDRSVATASFKNHLLTVKGIDEGQTKATIELTDAHGNTMKKVINNTVNLTEEQLEQKQEEEAALRAVQEEEEKAQKEKEKKEAE